MICTQTDDKYTMNVYFWMNDLPLCSSSLHSLPGYLCWCVVVVFVLLLLASVVKTPVPAFSFNLPSLSSEPWVMLRTSAGFHWKQTLMWWTRYTSHSLWHLLNWPFLANPWTSLSHISVPYRVISILSRYVMLLLFLVKWFFRALAPGQKCGAMNWLLFYVQHVDGPKFPFLPACIGYGS